MKKLISIAAPIFTLLACTVSSAALAQGMQPLLPQDERIKMLPYDETDVYTITTKPGYQTNIVFGRGEEIETVSVGERSFWQIIPNGNRMFIRPLNENVATNMTVITSRHSYQFDLKSIGSDDDEGNIYVAKFVYEKRMPGTGMPMAPMPMAAPVPMQPVMGPMPQTAPMPAPVPENQPLPPGTQPMGTTAPSAPLADTAGVAPGSLKPPYTPPPCVPPECVPPGAQDTAPVYNAGPGISHPVGPNFNYTYSGPDDLSPLQVYDDGKSTFISYRQTNEPLPNIYLVDTGGNERPTTYYLKGEAMVVDTVAPKMALKSSSGTVYIYNELLSPQ